MIKHLLAVTKPGIIFGNLVTVIGGFFLASQGVWHATLFFNAVVGITLVIASGCAINNVIDRDIDKVMERTQNRVMVLGLLPPWLVLAYGALLGCLGFVLLSFTNPLTLYLGLLGFIVYVGIYSLWAKRHTVYGTLIGSISGAIPLVVGYTSVTGQLDAAAIILFFICALWQMPHSYAIAMYRDKDYRNAHIPVLPIAKNEHTAKVHSIGYILAFTVFCILLFAFGYTGGLYLLVILLLSGYWLILARKGFHTTNNHQWAKRMFFYSILVITVFSVLIAVPA